MSGNLMQRTFDVLGAATTTLTCSEIAERLRLDDEIVRGALKRLRSTRCLHAVCMDGSWRYGLRHGAERPEDRRGRHRT